MPDVSDYEDAVRRIANAEVDPNSTTAAEVAQDLSAAEAPQVTREVAQGVADAIVTEDRVLGAIEETGEIPSEAEIDAIASVADDYGMGDRVDAVSNEVSDRVATIEEIDAAVDEARSRAASEDRPTFREDVESAVDQLADRQQFVGESPDQVADEQAREVGAPSRQAFERAAAQTAATGEQVTPADVVEGTSAKTPVSVIEDTGGDAVAAVGGPSAEIGEQVADELGVDYMSTDDVTDEMGVEGTGSTVDLTLRGRRVGTVDVRGEQA